MSQATGVIANASGAAVRAAINAANAAAASGHSGTIAPTYVVGGMLYWRTDVPGAGVWTLYAYDGASSVAVGTLNTSTHVWAPAGALSTGIMTTQGDLIYQGASGAARLAAGSDAYKALFSGGAAANPTLAGTWKVLGQATPSGEAAVDFTGIPSGVHHLELRFELVPATNAVHLLLQTYGADGVLDTGGSDYQSQIAGVASNAAGANSAQNTSAIYMGITDVARALSNDSSAGGISGSIKFSNIQAARHTRCVFDAAYGPDTFASHYWRTFGSGIRLEADRITGVRLITTSGNLSGRAVLLGMSS